MFTYAYLRERYQIPRKIEVSWGLIETDDIARLALVLHGSKVYLDIAGRRFCNCKNVNIYPAKRTRLNEESYLFSAEKPDGQLLVRRLPKTYLDDMLYAMHYSADLEENPPL